MKNILLSITLLLLIACGEKNTTEFNNEPISRVPALNDFQWLLGSWKFVNNDGSVMHEIWKKESDSLYKGHGFVIAGKDTVFSEQLAIEKRGSDLFYIPTVTGQNNGHPVLFKFMEFYKGEYIFVNKEHDFPQRIIYKNPQPDFLCARIEGTQDGKFRKEDFNFLRVAN